MQLAAESSEGAGLSFGRVLSGSAGGAPCGRQKLAQVPQVGRGAAQPQRELGELVGLRISVSSAHLPCDLADPALDPRLLGLERVCARVTVRKRALDVCPRLIVAGRWARDESVQLVT